MYFCLSLVQLDGQTERATVHFTGPSSTSNDWMSSMMLANVSLTNANIEELHRIQMSDGSFGFDMPFGNVLSIDRQQFDALKCYLYEQGLRSLGKTRESGVATSNDSRDCCLAFDIQEEILRLIATGIYFVMLLIQVPVIQRDVLLFPFDAEQITVRINEPINNRLRSVRLCFIGDTSSATTGTFPKQCQSSDDLLRAETCPFIGLLFTIGIELFIVGQIHTDERLPNR
jgi:hypothetical protein